MEQAQLVFDQLILPLSTRRYILPLSDYAVFAEELLAQNVTRAVLVASSHVNPAAGFPRSSMYIDGVRDFLVSKGMSVELQLGRDPDVDLAYMARATFVAVGGGGFSHTVAGLVGELGGKVLLPPSRPKRIGWMHDSDAPADAFWEGAVDAF